MPTPKRKPAGEMPKPTTMDFPEALRQVIKGKKITKLEWGNPKFFVYLWNSHLSLQKEDGENYDLIVSDGDLMGLDWVVLE